MCSGFVRIAGGGLRYGLNTNAPMRFIPRFEPTAVNIATEKVNSQIPIRRMRCEITIGSGGINLNNVRNLTTRRSRSRRFVLLPKRTTDCCRTSFCISDIWLWERCLVWGRRFSPFCGHLRKRRCHILRTSSRSVGSRTECSGTSTTRASGPKSRERRSDFS